MDRRNYPAIINCLADERIITQMGRKGSLDLHATLMSYKPRNRRIPGRVIEELLVRDRILDEEFAKILETSKDPKSMVLVENGAGAPA